MERPQTPRSVHVSQGELDAMLARQELSRKLTAARDVLSPSLQLEYPLSPHNRSSLGIPDDVIHRVSTSQSLFDVATTAVLERDHAERGNTMDIREGVMSERQAVAEIFSYTTKIREILHTNDYSQLQVAADMLTVLAEKIPDLYIRMYSELMQTQDLNASARLAVVESLIGVPSQDRPEYRQFVLGQVQDIMRDPSIGLKEAALAATHNLLQSGVYAGDVHDVLQRGLKDREPRVRGAILQHLPLLFEVDTQLASQVQKTALQDKDIPQDKVTPLLHVLAQRDPEAVLQYFLIAQGTDSKAAEEMVTIIENIGNVNSARLEVLIDNLLKSDTYGVEEKVITCFPLLATRNPHLLTKLLDRFVSLPELQRKDLPQPVVDAVMVVLEHSDASQLEPLIASRLNTFGNRNDMLMAEILPALATTNPTLYRKIFLQIMQPGQGTYTARERLIKTFGLVAKINPEEYALLFRQGMESTERYKRDDLAKTLASYAEAQPEAAFQLFEHFAHLPNADNEYSKTLGTMLELLVENGNRRAIEYVRTAVIDIPVPSL